jgi:hypothetical protein
MPPLVARPAAAGNLFHASQHHWTLQLSMQVSENKSIGAAYHSQLTLANHLCFSHHI